jgi:hypothetical protein
MAGGGSLDIGSIIGQIASGGVGGGVLMVIVGLIKQAMGGTEARPSSPLAVVSVSQHTTGRRPALKTPELSE